MLALACGVGVQLSHGDSTGRVAGERKPVVTHPSLTPTPMVTLTYYGTPQNLPSQTAIGAGANAQDWAAAILVNLGAQVNIANVASLVAWFGQESNHGSAGQEADGIGRNNPLSITGASGIAGADGSVPSGAGPDYPANLAFPTPAVGIAAIGQALASYPAILAALQSGLGLPEANEAAVARELTEWSGGGYNSVWQKGTQ
jgi:hypothetical protein